MSTYAQIIEKSLRLLTPTSNEQQLQIASDYTAGSGTLVVDSTSPAYAQAGRPGTILACGLQLWVVQKDNGSGNLSVIGGYQGSTDANVTHSATSPTATVIVKPKFSRFDISVAINDELLALGSAENGLGQILAANVTYIPSFMGYNLPTTFDPVASRVLEVSYAEPLPWLRNPRIRPDKYRVIRNQDTASGFTNPCAIVLYPTQSGHPAAFPGLPVRVQFLAPFTTLTNLTDNVQSVAGLPAYMEDILTWGAVLRLADTREIQRNTMMTQSDSRKGQDVPPGAIGRSASALQARYLERLSQERQRIASAYPYAER
jgi:hypothetical protein